MSDLVKKLKQLVKEAERLIKKRPADFTNLALEETLNQLVERIKDLKKLIRKENPHE